MLDYQSLSRFRENNRIEAKKAGGGLPESIWETYSAFANTLGGVILLGVVEKKNHTLFPTGVTSAKDMVEEFLRLLPEKANRNILSPSDIRIESNGKKDVIVINVPRARKSQKPIYIGSDPYSGTYKRFGEGDYHCTKAEVDGMLQDAKEIDFDMKEMPYKEGMLSEKSVKAYNERTNSPLEIGKTIDYATILLLGTKSAINEIAPNFYAKYACDDDETPKEYENLYDYFMACEAASHLFKITFITISHEFIAEAILNAVLNADYEKGGVSMYQTDDKVVIQNSGTFCVDKNLAISGGISQIRNERLSDLFIPIVGDRKGSGLHKIYYYWDILRLPKPIIEESSSPDMITFTLDKKLNREDVIKYGIITEHMIISVLTIWPKKRFGGLYQAYAAPKKAIQEKLDSLIERGIVVQQGKYYMLKR